MTTGRTLWQENGLVLHEQAAIDGHSQFSYGRQSATEFGYPLIVVAFVRR